MINIIKIAVFTILLTLSKQAPDFKCPDTESENNCDSATQYCNASNVCSNAGGFRSQCSEKSATIKNGNVCLDNYVCGTKKQCLNADGHECLYHYNCSGYCEGYRNCAPRVAFGATCGFSEACLSNKCDDIKKQCVVALKDSCENSAECQTGAICSSNGTCLLETEQNCTNNNQCVSNLCQSDKCVSENGENAGNTGNSGNTGNTGNAEKTQKTPTSTENSSSGEIRCLTVSAMVLAIAAFFL